MALSCGVRSMWFCPSTMHSANRTTFTKFSLIWAWQIRVKASDAEHSLQLYRRNSFDPNSNAERPEDAPAVRASCQTRSELSKCSNWRESAGIFISRNILCQSQHHLCGAPHSGPNFDLHSELSLRSLTLTLSNLHLQSQSKSHFKAHSKALGALESQLRSGIDVHRFEREVSAKWAQQPNFKWKAHSVLKGILVTWNLTG